jgi:hypothetical protein
VISVGKPPTWRLVHNSEGSDETDQENTNITADEAEELVVSVQGIVLRRDELPPFRDRIGYLNHNTVINLINDHLLSDPTAKAYSSYAKDFQSQV